jgi:hypothetical protein
MLKEIAAPDKAFSVLDIGAASGDMGDRVRAWYPRAQVFSMDYRLEHLAGCAPPKFVADAFQRAVRPRSVDFTFCSLFLHHFTDPQIVSLLADFAQMARRAVLVIDLERNPIPHYFLPASRPVLGWDPVTVHDGKISVEAAFHPEELEALARQAGLRKVRARTHRPAFRVSLIGEC